MSDQYASRPGSRLEPAAVGLFFGLVGIITVIYGSQTWYPPLASRHGAGIDAMLNFLLVVTGIMLVVGHVVLGFFVWRGGGQERVTVRVVSRRTERSVSVALGLFMTLAAEGGVLAIGMPVWAEYFGAEPPADAVRLEVTAQQFAWNVRYPGSDGVLGRTRAELIDDADNPIGIDSGDTAAADDIVLLNHIYVPVGRSVRVQLRSKDVIHSFFLPHMRVKQDAVPGMMPEVVFVPTREGTFPIACAELCGLAHYRMQGYLHVVSDEEYDRWLHERAAEL